MFRAGHLLDHYSALFSHLDGRLKHEAINLGASQLGKTPKASINFNVSMSRYKNTSTVRLTTDRGGFCQNELILEFPTKSMPSDFCAQDTWPLGARALSGRRHLAY
jgi:hypothetical protein